jgi:D-alanyl-D-alanine carboxypeptidase
MRQLECSLKALVQTDRVPGLQYVVVDATSRLLEVCAGSAQLRTRPMTADTTMMAYSMSKTITAAAVLQLIERGRLGIDDVITKYLPWQPYGDGITVRRLLSHTAGIPNPLPLRWVHAVSPGTAFDEHAALLEVVRRHPKLTARPGTRFAYSNIGYWLLGSLIEQISGEAFASYVGSQVFAPLGLTAGEMAYEIRDSARHASGHLRRWSLFALVSPFLIDRDLIGGHTGRWLEIRPHYVNGPAFGGIVASARSFATFLQDQLRAHSCVLGRQARSLMVERQRIPRGEIPMTLGWHVGSLGPDRYYFKEGGGGGFHGMMRCYKERGFGTVLMVNAATFNVSRALDAADARLLAS